MTQLLERGDMLIGRGHYVGHIKASGRPVRFASAHFWSFDGDRFAAVEQVTDSAPWRAAHREETFA